MNWGSKKVLVIGADWFIGSHLVEKLKKTCRWVQDNLSSYKVEIYNV